MHQKCQYNRNMHFVQHALTSNSILQDYFLPETQSITATTNQISLCGMRKQPPVVGRSIKEIDQTIVVGRQNDGHFKGSIVEIWQPEEWRRKEVGR